MTGTLRLFAIATLFTLGACVVDIMQENIHRPAVKSTFTYAAADHDFTTVVYGNPFELPDEDVETAITDAMRGHHRGPPTNFTTRPSDNARDGYRMVMMFDPPLTMISHKACGDVSMIRPEPRTGRIRLLIAFCAGDDIHSEVMASMPATPSPRDPGFANMIARAMWLLIPPKDPHRTGGRCPNQNAC